MIHAPMVRRCCIVLLMWTSGKTFPPVTPPPEVPGGGAVLWPSEPLKIPARSNSKKSGARPAPATWSSRRVVLAAHVSHPLGLVYLHPLVMSINVNPKHVMTL